MLPRHGTRVELGTDDDVRELDLAIRRRQEQRNQQQQHQRGDTKTTAATRTSNNQQATNKNGLPLAPVFDD